MRICIDTSSYSLLKRGDSFTVSLLEKADEVLVPAIVLGELYAGFYMGTHTEKNSSELEAFLKKPGVTVVDVDIHIAQRYGHLVKTLKNQGAPLPTNDVWIASIAFETGAKLHTRDSHFQQVPGLFLV